MRNFWAGTTFFLFSFHVVADRCFEPDHYISYPFLASPPFISPTETIDLEDQFTLYEDVSVIMPINLLNPATKLDSHGEFEPKKPKLHYTSFLLDGIDDTPTGVFVEVTNQFGLFPITNENLMPANSLLVPSCKNACVDNDISIESPFFNGDHYLCYPLTGLPAVTPIPTGSLSDQFQERLFSGLTPSRFCNPVRKTRGTHVDDFHDNPENHLMCFTLTPTTNLLGDTFSVLNQFGLQRGMVRTDDELCVPSTKENVIPTCFDLVDVPTPFTIRYVGSAGVDAANDCTNIATPCATIAHAYTEANLDPGTDVIEILDGTINEPTEVLIDDEGVFIFGQGVNSSTINAGGNHRHFNINNTTAAIEVTICGLTITGGLVVGIANADRGGSIRNSESMSIINSDLSGNSSNAGGGAIFNDGTATINNTTLSNNSANAANGGAIFNAGTTTVTNSTLNDNNAGPGGAIFNSLGTTNITNSTISGNTASIAGGAILNGAGTTDLIYTTITDNTTPVGSGAVDQTGGIVNVDRTAIGDNIGADCSGTINDTLSIDSDGSCGGSTTFPDFFLKPLANYGGPTDTHLPNGPLNPNPSPLVDFIPNASCNPPNTDQRGFPRPSIAGGNCDVGSVERQPSDPQ